MSEEQPPQVVEITTEMMFFAREILEDPNATPAFRLTLVPADGPMLSTRIGPQLSAQAVERLEDYLACMAGVKDPRQILQNVVGPGGPIMPEPDAAPRPPDSPAFSREWLVSALRAGAARFLFELAAIRVLAGMPDRLRSVQPLKIASTQGDMRDVPMDAIHQILTNPVTNAPFVANAIIDARGSFLRGSFGYLLQYQQRHGNQVDLIMSQPWYFFLKVVRNLVSHIAHEEMIDFKPTLRRQLTARGLDPALVTWRGFTIREGERADQVRFNDVDCMRLNNEVAAFAESNL